MLRQAGVSGHAYPVGVHQPRLFVHPRPRSLLPRLQLSFGFCLLDWHWGGGFERKRRKYPVEFLRIPLRLSLSLSPSLLLSQLRHSSFFLGKLFWIWEEGETQTNPLSLTVSWCLSRSWFRWNLIWIAAFGSAATPVLRCNREEKEKKIKKVSYLIKSAARKSCVNAPEILELRGF